MKKKISLFEDSLSNEVDVKEAVFEKDYRKNLRECLGLENISFEGDILSIRLERTLIRNLYFEYEKEGEKIRAKEAHVYVYSGLPFLSFSERDIVSFKATAYVYRRKDGSFDIGLKNANDINRIYVIPADDEHSKAEKLTCKRCKYKKECNGICLIPKERDKRIIKNIWKERTEKWLKEYSSGIVMNG